MSVGEQYNSISEVNIEDVSPMMKHYIETKLLNPDCILFYRLGDFYEMFFDDAVLVSKELELALTGKACGLETRAAMCGVPYHAADNYITRLTAKGYKVAICEQLEDPKQAKGIVKRDIVRIVTPGTNISPFTLDDDRHNYICCVAYMTDSTGIATADITTGDFLLTEVESLSEATDEIIRFMPSELIANDAFMMSGADIETLKEKTGFVFNRPDQKFFDPDKALGELTRYFKVSNPDALGIAEFPCGIQAAGALLSYIFQMQHEMFSGFTHIYTYKPGRFMLLDSTARRNLELTETLRDKTKKGSLLWVLDKTCTAMGARMLREWVEQPLIDYGGICLRQEAVGCIFDNPVVRGDMRECLKPIYDLERLMTRISYKSASPRDLLSFSSSLKLIKPLKNSLLDLTKCAYLQNVYDDIDELDDICALIENSISPDAPLSPREGSVIREGCDEEIDRLRDAETNGKKWLLELEEETRSGSGIKNLKIKYVNNFGYVFEVSKSYTGDVPSDFVRRQTLTGCERYTNEKLKALEDEILHSREKLFLLEYEMFCTVRDKIAEEIKRVKKTANAVARLDAVISLAHAADIYNYVKPEIAEDDVIEIKGGRHPVIERMMRDGTRFISNDTLLDSEENTCLIITGPNMAGKSTYMRQSALIVLLAQMGSFVPAESAHIGICDRIFTRVGASDDLSSGRSTFMVEMSEVAQILRGATNRSLLILDEIGRGTSTYDGLSIAYAVVEYVADKKRLGARTLFATHYHELTKLEGKNPGVKNLRSTVKESEDSVVFLHKIVPGGADKSYGIQVAKIAGLPDEIIKRANEISGALEKEAGSVETLLPEYADTGHTSEDLPAGESHPETPGNGYLPESVQFSPDSSSDANVQLSFADFALESKLVSKIKNLDINSMTPIEALTVLNDLRNEAVGV